MKLRERTESVFPGLQAGKLTVLGHQWRDGKHWRCVCECQCGNVVSMLTQCIGRTCFSCGCGQRESARKVILNLLANRIERGECRTPEESTRSCERCGKSFRGRKQRISRFCSKECRSPGGARRHTCETCGNVFRDSRSNARFCSCECSRLSQINAARRTGPCQNCGTVFTARKCHGRWKIFCCRGCWRSYVKRIVDEWDISVKDEGYIVDGVEVRQESDRGEHRTVVENFLGRKLIPTSEPIVHLNGDKSDNRLENLYLFASRADMISAFQSDFPERSNLVELVDKS